jgi:pimeloyl-ACP methyl ester carboxylesterase
MPPLVLLAGMNCTADLWTGCGLDDALTPVLAESSVVGQVDRLLSELPPLFVLGGLSLGAIVGMALAARAPERVAALCLVSTNAKGPTSLQCASWQEWMDRLDAGESPRDLQSGILGELLTPVAISERPELVDRTLAMADDTGSSMLRRQLEMQLTRTDLRPDLRRVEAPTLVVSGAQDAVCPPEFHADIASRLRRGRVVTLDGGHLLPLERPDAFGELVRTWCERSYRDG